MEPCIVYLLDEGVELDDDLKQFVEKDNGDEESINYQYIKNKPDTLKHQRILNATQELHFFVVVVASHNTNVE